MRDPGESAQSGTSSRMARCEPALLRLANGLGKLRTSESGRGENICWCGLLKEPPRYIGEEPVPGMSTSVLLRIAPKSMMGCSPPGEVTSKTIASL